MAATTTGRSVSVALFTICCLTAISHTISFDCVAAVKSTARFTVADSVQMTVLTDPDAVLAAMGFMSSDVKWSPSRSMFTVVTRQGNLSQGCDEYRMLLFISKEVLHSIEVNTQPHNRVLATFCSASNQPGISRVSWLGGEHEVAFLGESKISSAQLFTVDVISGKLTLLTHSAGRVLDYGLQAAQRFVYMAESNRTSFSHIEPSYVVGTEPLMRGIRGGSIDSWTDASFFVGTRDGKEPIALDEASYELVDANPYGIWLSPSGRWAVALRHVPNPPDYWVKYGPIARELKAEGFQGVSSKNYIGDHPFNFLQFILIDAGTGTSKPLIDAPSGLFFGGITLSAHWAADERSVILASTFLPNSPSSEPGFKKSNDSAAIVEINVATHDTLTICELNAEDENGGLLTDTTMTADGSLIVHQQRRARAFSKATGQWSEVSIPTHDLQVFVTQGLNESPNLAAKRTLDDRQTTITDLNPRFRGLEMGLVKPIKWKDASGHEWRGGLLLPPDSKSGQRRYPLVIQTHGFNPSVFLIDGPAGSASGFAARALAARNIAVLQVDDITDEFSGRDELTRHVDAYKSAIHTLEAEGIIDATRVGIHGWSRTGLYVEQALVFSDIKFAAATIADANEVSEFQTIFSYGMFYPGMMGNESLIGVPLWGDENASVWAARDPTFHLDRVNSPLLIQNYSTQFQWFDIYALLRRHGRPVELESFPGGMHLLRQPLQRYAAQEAIVDWYDFWLNLHEDPKDSKSSEYQRWRDLRALSGAGS